MSKIAWVIITDGRRDCITRTITSALANVKADFHKKFIVNDAADPKYHWFLDSHFPDFDVLSHETRRGLAGAVQSAWSYVKDVDYIFHLEEDFIFNRSVDINEIIKILEYNPNLAQMAFVRDSVNPAEAEVGGFINQHPEAYEDKDGWIEQGRLFTLNPCVYPYTTTLIGWPDHGSEGDFTTKIHGVFPEARFGYWGQRNDPPLVQHIGHTRTQDWVL